MTHCRIGKVKFKNGAEVTILEDWRCMESQFMKTARRVPRSFDVDMTGYIVVGIGADGSYVINYNIGNTIITPSLAPSWLKDIMLREITERGTLEAIEYIGDE